LCRFILHRPPTQTTTEAEERNCTTTSVASAAAGGFLTDAFSAALSHYLPFHAAAPAAGFLSHPFLSHFTHLTQPTAGLDSRVGSRALSALASSQKRPLENYQEQEQEQEQKIKRTRLYEYPLDLSPTSCGPMFDNDDVDILSIDPPSPSDVEQWSVDRVVDFVTHVESCRDYAQVIVCLFMHWIISSRRYIICDTIPVDISADNCEGTLQK
jgi:hypothetical protein